MLNIDNLKYKILLNNEYNDVYNDVYTDDDTMAEC